MINLNEDKFKGKENAVKVFNNGNAGEVIVNVKVERKAPGEPSNTPDWKVFFVEKSGTDINKGFWYLDSTRDGYENKLAIEGRILRDILRSLYGDTVALPSKPTYRELLDACMEMIAARPTTDVKIGVTYGTVKYPNKKGYLQLKNTFPFITGDLAESIDFNWDYDLKHRPKSDSEVSEDSKEGSSTEAPW